MNDGQVRSIESLNFFERADEAKAILERLARDCAPLLRRRKWNIKKLKEFFPKDPGLLGMNVNRSNILIRLRPYDR